MIDHLRTLSLLPQVFSYLSRTKYSIVSVMLFLYGVPLDSYFWVHFLTGISGVRGGLSGGECIVFLVFLRPCCWVCDRIIGHEKNAEVGIGLDIRRA